MRELVAERDAHPAMEVSSAAPLEEALRELRWEARDAYGEWYVVVREGFKEAFALSGRDLERLAYEYGFDARLRDIEPAMWPADVVDEEALFSLDDARDRLRASGKPALVVMAGGRPRGVILASDLGIEYREQATGPITLGPPTTLPTTSGSSSGASVAVPPSNLESVVAEPTPPKRYANILLAPVGAEGVIPDKTDLAIRTWYDLRLNIGEKSRESVPLTSDDEAFPSEGLPPKAGGHWLQAVAVSETLNIPRRRFDFYLPNSGESWVCACEPGKEHTCLESEREHFVTVRFETPRRPGPADLRLGIYYQNNLVQSQLLRAAVAEKEGAGLGCSREIDFTLVGRLDDVGYLPARTVNILTNQNPDGTHRMVVNGIPEDVLAFTLTEGVMGGAIRAVRQSLRDIHYQDKAETASASAGKGGKAGRPGFLDRLRRIWDVGLLGDAAEKTNLLRDDNSKGAEEFIADLKRLAPLGATLYGQLLINNSAVMNDRFRALLDPPGTIQVARPRGSNFVFPWSLVYDIRLATSRPQDYHLCELLDHWDSLKANIADRQWRECPYKSSHGTNTICPYGFWGYRHIIEQLPSAPPDGRVRTSVDSERPVELVVARSKDMDDEPPLRLASTHVRKVREGLPTDFTLVDVDSLKGLVDAVANRNVEILYFYCHGRRREVAGTGGQTTPYLEIGSAEPIEPNDILTWENDWKRVSPLVIINGCHTAELTPEALTSFVDMFSVAYAAGVIGTEITLHQSVAGEAAEQFLMHFDRQQPVGLALQRMRQHLLAKSNLLGLAYTAYCSADLVLS